MSAATQYDPGAKVEQLVKWLQKYRNDALLVLSITTYRAHWMTWRVSLVLFH